jgi:hypothetical protein
VAAVGANFVPSLFSDAVKGDRIAPLQVTELAADGSQTGVAVLRWRSPAAAPDGDLPTEYCIYKLTRPQLSHEYVAETAIFTLGEDGFSNVPGDVCEYWYPASGGQTYYYAVTARDSVGNESPPLVSDGCTPLADEVLPNAPEAVEAFSGTGPQQESLPEGLVLLRWREPQAASDGDLPRYYLLRRGDGSAASMRVIAQKKAQQPGGLLTFLDLTATAGCVYYYEIRSVDKARNESPAQAPLAARPQPPARAALLEPEDGFACLEAEGDERAQLLWSAALPAADEVSGYLVEYSLDSGFRQNVFSTRAYEARGENYGCDLPLAPLAAGTWFWRVKTEFASGVVSYSAIRRFGVVRKQQAAKEKGALSYVALEPKVLSGNAAATIYLALKIPASVSIRVFDSRGRLVKLIAQNEFRADVASWQWDGRDQAGRRLADGLYFVQIRAIAPPEPETTVLKRVQIFN